MIAKVDGGDFDAEGEENPGGSVFLGGVLVQEARRGREKKSFFFLHFVGGKTLLSFG